VLFRRDAEVLPAFVRTLFAGKVQLKVSNGVGGLLVAADAFFTSQRTQIVPGESARALFLCKMDLEWGRDD
jgi:hypothetical protein